ncbi:cytochrome c oxidase assembly factor 1 homolog [Zerene cesonia]|uniref:cytochrome c oxidase assembly factor 1 homolog n=1 Tax=Zerene cesonia TaxID=33412 RepID=UPI0018E4EC22|nr:cytochrome c oxidase assembly factor 1 homolog [Zerene cesonia]
MTYISNSKLLQIAAIGGFVVASTGLYLQTKLVDKVRDLDYYRLALKKLRSHPGAVFYLGEPIKDKRFKIRDSEKNYCDQKTARFKIPVSGPKDRGSYFIWAENQDEKWSITKAELELKSRPDERLVIIQS